MWDEAPAQASPEALRAVCQALDALPPLSASWRALVDFAAGYYQRGVGEVALSVLPPELRGLDAAGLAKRVSRLAAVQGAAGRAATRRPALNAEQARGAGADRRPPAPAPTLLHGVTGSGKTEVYLRAAARALARRPAGAGAGARDQPHAAARGALRRALRRARRWCRCTAA